MKPSKLWTGAVLIAVSALTFSRPASAIQCLDDDECWHRLQQDLTEEMRRADVARDVFSACAGVDAPLESDVLPPLLDCLKKRYAGYGAEAKGPELVLFVFGSTEAADSARAWDDLSFSLSRHHWRLYGKKVAALEDRRRRSRER